MALKLEKYKSGTYRNQGDFSSFIPSPINTDWTWETPKINSLLNRASSELGGLNSFAELVPDIDTYIMMHIKVEANKSNRIEGTNTTIEEDMMPIEDINPEHRDDALEVGNYIKALNYGIDRIQKDDFPFTTRLLREIHKILLVGVRGEHKTPGEFRTSQNFIGGSMPSNAKYVPPAVPDMQEALSDFDKFMNRENDDLPVLIRLAMMHYQFETIHPFLDGNGRIGRIMIPLYLLSQKELAKPCFYISYYFEEHRQEYYEALQNVREKNDMIGWICFFLRASIETAQTAKQKFRLAVEQVNWYKEYLMNKRTGADSLRTIIRAMYSQPVATVNQLIELTGLSAATVNNVVKILTMDQILLEMTGNRRNRIFVLKDYLRVFS